MKFKKLTEILDALGKNDHNLDAEEKEDLRGFLGEVLEGVKEGETSENIVSKFREKLKTEVKNELSDEIGQKASELKQLEASLSAKNNGVKSLSEQPKQSNGAKYTATVGMGLAAGLIAFTVLERTVRLEMLVMIGIAVVSALVAGGITYAALPSTQVDGVKAQEVNENGKSK